MWTRQNGLIEVIRATLAMHAAPTARSPRCCRPCPSSIPPRCRSCRRTSPRRWHAPRPPSPRGWLRLLASEVTGVRFQWPALRSIGKAQWQLADFVGARRTWLRLREVSARRPRRLSRPGITAALTNKRTTADQRAQALALQRPQPEAAVAARLRSPGQPREGIAGMISCDEED